MLQSLLPAQPEPEMSNPPTAGAGPFARPARFAAEEWAARVQLAAAYRIFDHLGWT